jgi:thiamine kinase-like enzyme
MCNLSYITAAMPRHGDCVMAMVFTEQADSSAQQQILSYLAQLENDDFEIANEAYLHIRHAKKLGWLHYAIAQTNAQAISELMAEMAKPKSSFGWLFGSKAKLIYVNQTN